MMLKIALPEGGGLGPFQVLKVGDQWKGRMLTNVSRMLWFVGRRPWVTLVWNWVELEITEVPD